MLDPMAPRVAATVEIAPAITVRACCASAAEFRDTLAPPPLRLSPTTPPLSPLESVALMPMEFPVVPSVLAVTVA